MNDDWVCCQLVVRTGQRSGHEEGKRWPTRLLSVAYVVWLQQYSLAPKIINVRALFRFDFAGCGGSGGDWKYAGYDVSTYVAMVVLLVLASTDSLSCRCTSCQTK